MSLRKLNLLIWAAALLLVAASCKKEEETETKPSLSGLTFNCPSFVAPRQTVKMTPSGITHPEGGEVGYCWKVTPTMKYYDTTDVFEHRFSDTLKTYTVTCYAYADGYTGDSYSRDVIVVRGGIDGTVTDTDILASDRKIVVDGVSYYYEKIGNLDWFRTNLAAGGSGAPYVNAEVTSDVFGRFYSYNEAMTACPAGWRLPSDEDWRAMTEALGAKKADAYAAIRDVNAMLMADASFNGTKIIEYWPEVGEITNSSRLSLLPFGYANLGTADGEGEYPNASFDGIFDYAVYWTADKVDGQGGMAYYRYLISDQPDMLAGRGDVATFGASVRCVRDAE